MLNIANSAFAAVLAVIGTITTVSTSTKPVEVIVVEPEPKTLEMLIEEAFPGEVVMRAIAHCESTTRHYLQDGSVVRGKVNDMDVGLYQINEYYHLETSKKLGIDIYTPEGNIAYAKILYKKNGYRDWNSSKPCWGKYQS